jgi:hypothetical protein
LSTCGAVLVAHKDFAMVVVKFHTQKSGTQTKLFRDSQLLTEHVLEVGAPHCIAM